ncbi:MAG: hypothetical protein AAF703_05060 [Cyanobacteria bacterium P01_D01_bin.105]
MFIRLMQATAITVALYGLLGLNDLQTMTSEAEQSEAKETEVSIHPPEVLVALKEALTKRQQ